MALVIIEQRVCLLLLVVAPPRGLGAAEELWHESVIVRGHLLVIVRGLVPSLTESRKVTLVDCSCH